MNDDQIIDWLIRMTTHVAQLHAGRKPSNAGPKDDLRTITWEDEGFARWMGWRGQEAQERETAWPAEELRQERAERSRRRFRELREENAELKSFLRSLRDELDRRLGK
jgi:hypothetical protein